MKVLLDLNVVLDVILNREPWVAVAKQIWNAHQSGVIDGCLAATEITNLFYIVRRTAGEPVARNAMQVCLATFNIEPIGQLILEAADRQPGLDFEDNVCIACAVAAAADLIVTRDPAGFTHSPVTAVSPEELMARVASTNP